MFVQIPLAGSIQGDPSKLRKIPGAVRCSDCIKNDEKTVAAGQAQATKAKAAIGKAKARKNKVKKVAQKGKGKKEQGKEGCPEDEGNKRRTSVILMVECGGA